MNIMPVAQVNNSKSFKGLWGNTIPKKEVTKNTFRLDVYDYITREYHPFADESLEALSNVLKKNSTYKTENSKEIENCLVHTGINICIKSNLLFTTKQWMNYISNKMITGCPEFNFIEKNLKNLHLDKYLRA